jgi:molybdopterin converting factor small subunit
MIYVDEERAGLETPVGAGSEVRIIPAVSGG